MNLFFHRVQKFIITTSFIALGICPFSALAEGVSYTIHHHYAAPRALAMGDAFVAVADDYNAIFYNPAGLAFRENAELNMDLSFALSSQILKFFSDVQSAQSTPGTDSQKQQAMINVISNAYGNTYGLRGGLGGIYVRPNWGIAGILADGTLEMTPHQQVGPAVNTTFFLDTTFAYGYAKKVNFIPKSETSVGITAKFVNRANFSKAINVVELAADPNVVKNSDLKEGYTVDFDIGLLTHPEVSEIGFLKFMSSAKPSFGIVMRNVLETGFGQSLKLIQKEGSEKPEKMYRVIDIGSKFELPKIWIWGGRAVVDFRDILHPDITTKKSLHAGLELDWTLYSWWKGHWSLGVNQGYWTAGLSALLGVFNLDLYSYGEEVGTSSSPVENRVYGLRMNLNF